MNNYDKLTEKLKVLILKEDFLEYITVLHTAIKNAPTEEDINSLFELFFKLEFEYEVYLNLEYREQYKELLQLIKELLLQLLSLGIIPDRSYLYLYVFFTKYSFKEDQRITDLLNFFKEDILTLSWDSPEKITENNIIFLLEILNGNDKKALTEYIKNLLPTNIYIAQKVFTITFIEEFEAVIDDLNINIILDAFKFYLNLEEYQKLSLNEKKSLFAWTQQLLVNDGPFAKDIQTKQIYSLLKNVIDYHIKNNEIEELMYVEFFTMLSQFTITQQAKDNAIFNQQITYPCSEVYEKFSKEQNLLQTTEYNNSKKKIAFVFERLISHSPFKVVFELLKELQNNSEFTEKFEISVYSLNYFAPELTNTKKVEEALLEIGVKVVYAINTYTLNDHYASRTQRAIKIRNKFIEDKIDIMIACCNSYDILNFLFVSRTAPLQIYWSHGNTEYNVKHIDKKISHGPKKHEGLRKFGNQTYQSFSISYTIDMLSPSISKNNIELERAKYPKDKIILGVIGRLIKVDSTDYLKTIIEVMQKNPQTIYLACGSGNYDSIIQKIQGIDQTILDRFFFPGHVNSHLYGHIIDIWADTFPMPQGQSRMEAGLKGCALVIYSDKATYQDKLPEDYSQGVRKYYKQFQGERLTTPQLYKDFLNEIIINKDLRDFVAKYEKENYMEYLQGNISSFLQLLEKEN